jgi:hypothetical protein
MRVGNALVGILVFGLLYNMLAGGAINVAKATEIGADYIARFVIAIVGVEPVEDDQ